jgi:hypothetical protein
MRTLIIVLILILNIKSYCSERLLKQINENIYRSDWAEEAKKINDFLIYSLNSVKIDPLSDNIYGTKDSLMINESILKTNDWMINFFSGIRGRAFEDAIVVYNVPYHLLIFKSIFNLKGDFSFLKRNKHLGRKLKLLFFDKNSGKFKEISLKKLGVTEKDLNNINKKNEELIKILHEQNIAVGHPVYVQIRAFLAAESIVFLRLKYKFSSNIIPILIVDGAFTFGKLILYSTIIVTILSIFILIRFFMKKFNKNTTN